MSPLRDRPSAAAFDMTPRTKALYAFGEKAPKPLQQVNMMVNYGRKLFEEEEEDEEQDDEASDSEEEADNDSGSGGEQSESDDGGSYTAMSSPGSSGALSSRKGVGLPSAPANSRKRRQTLPISASLQKKAHKLMSS